MKIIKSKYIHKNRMMERDNETQKKVGLLGAIIDNGNMGCVALTYSIIRALEIISIRLECGFQYYIFENTYNLKKIDYLCDELKISRNQIKWAPVGYLHKVSSRIKYMRKNREMKSKLRECDFVIDLTQGDSFTDIYGKERFLIHTKIKELVEEMGIPIILGPQTYGPFQNEKNRLYAKKIIQGSNMVISRDYASAAYLNSFCNKKIYVTTDLAFMLPFKKIERSRELGKIKVGVNVSSLLIKKKTEATITDFTLKTDYDCYIKELMDYLSQKENYEIHLIPHVGYDAVIETGTKYPKAIVHQKFETPIEAKNCIADMDIFIGSRMHATIAAFSSGVATIPVAYSRKFSGLYNNLGYPYVVDMQLLETQNAVQLTINYIKKFRELSDKGKDCISEVESKSKDTLRLLEKAIKQIGDR